MIADGQYDLVMVNTVPHWRLEAVEFSVGKAIDASWPVESGRGWRAGATRGRIQHMLGACGHQR